MNVLSIGKSIDFVDYSYYNWKHKLVLVLVHSFPISLIISDDISEIMIEKTFLYSDKIHNYLELIALRGYNIYKFNTPSTSKQSIRRFSQA